MASPQNPQTTTPPVVAAPKAAPGKVSDAVAVGATAASGMMILSAIANIVQYAQNAGLEKENEQIRSGLAQWQQSAQSLESMLRDLRERHLLTHTELETTRTHNARLHTEVARLKMEVERLKEQLARSSNGGVRP